MTKLIIALALPLFATPAFALSNNRAAKIVAPKTVVTALKADLKASKFDSNGFGRRSYSTITAKQGKYGVATVTLTRTIFGGPIKAGPKPEHETLPIANASVKFNIQTGETVGKVKISGDFLPR